MGRKKRTVALVLGSGGARGLAHIGIIEELLNRGYEITSISGTSMGALVGGIYAAGKLEDFKHWIEGVDKFKMFQLLDFTFRFDGLVKGSRIINTLKELVPDVPIEDLPIPFSAIATDVHAEKEIVFDSGCLFDAIRASISLPSFFRPVHKKDMVLMDGGILNPLPINRVQRFPGDRVIAVDVNAQALEETASSPRPEPSATDGISIFKEWWRKTFFSGHPDENLKEEPNYNYYNSLLQASHMMIRRISQLSVEIYKPDLLIEVPAAAYGVLEFYHSHEIIEMGRRAAITALDRNDRLHRNWRFWK